MKRKYSRGGLQDLRLTCGGIVVCNRCVIVLCLLDPDLGPGCLMYYCNPSWVLATCTFFHTINPSKLLFNQGWLTTPFKYWFVWPNSSSFSFNFSQAFLCWSSIFFNLSNKNLTVRKKKKILSCYNHRKKLKHKTYWNVFYQLHCEGKTSFLGQWVDES
jgi:hypothetical protein